MPDTTLASSNDDQDENSVAEQESLDAQDISPEERRRQFGQQEGREKDSFPLPSDDGDDADDEDDREP